MSTRLPLSASAAAHQVRQARSLDLGGHLRQLHLDGLESRDRPTEGLAFPAVRQCLVVGFLGDTHAAGGDVDASDLEAAQYLLQAAAFHPTQKVGRRHPHVIEPHFAALGALVAQLGEIT